MGTGLVCLTFISAVLQQDQQLSPVVLNQELLTCSDCTWHMKELCGQQLVKSVCLKSLAELGKSILLLAGEQEDPPTTEDCTLNLLPIGNETYHMHPYLPRVRC